MHAIERELLKATGYTPKPTARRQRTLEALVRRVQKLPDAAWDDLTGEAQEWANAGTVALDKGKQVTDFPADPEAPKKKKADTPKPKKTGGLDNRARLKRAAKPSAETMMKQLILRNLDITVDEMLEELQKAGYPTTRFRVSATRGTFRNSLQVLRDEGWLKKGF